MAKMPPIRQLKGRQLGRILIKMGVLTRDKVAKCLEIQQKKGGKTMIPYGPFLSTAALLYMFYRELIDYYLLLYLMGPAQY